MTHIKLSNILSLHDILLSKVYVNNFRPPWQMKPHMYSQEHSDIQGHLNEMISIFFKWNITYNAKASPQPCTKLSKWWNHKKIISKTKIFRNRFKWSYENDYFIFSEIESIIYTVSRKYIMMFLLQSIDWINAKWSHATSLLHKALCLFSACSFHIWYVLCNSKFAHQQDLISRPPEACFYIKKASYQFGTFRCDYI